MPVGSRKNRSIEVTRVSEPEGAVRSLLVVLAVPSWHADEANRIGDDHACRGPVPGKAGARILVS